MNREQENAERLLPKEKHVMRPSDIVALIVCLIIAFCSWLYVMNNESPESESEFRAIPVTLENVSELSAAYNLSVIDGWDNTVNITVRGRRSDIAKVEVSDVVASVDMGNVNGAGRFALGVNVELPAGLSFVSCSPSAVTVEVDEVSSKTVPVIVKIVEVKHDSTSEIGEPVAAPATVTVTGPASVLDRVASAMVLLNLGEIGVSTVAVAPVTLVDALGVTVDNPYLTTDVTSVSVTVPLYERKSVPLSVDTLYGYYNKDNCAVTIEPQSILLRGERSVISAIDSILLKTIDEKRITGDCTETVTVSIPKGTSSVDGVTSATITIKHKNTVQKTVSVNRFRVQGTGYSLVTESLEISLRGPAALLDKLTPSDITVDVPLTNLTGDGELRVEAGISFSEAFRGQVYELGTYYIKVRKN